MKISVALAVACLCVGMSVAAQSDASIKKYELNIPRQSLDTALKDLAQQTGLQIARFSDTIDGAAMVGPVSGSLTTTQALDNLLSTQGLSYKVVNDRTIAIVKPGAETASAGSEVGRPVDGKTPSGPTAFRVAQNEQKAENTDSANTQGSRDSSSSEESADSSESTRLTEIVVTAQKREERLQDVPVSISVLSGADLDRSTAEGISELLNRVPGVSTSVNAQGGGTQLTVRGVTAAADTLAGSSPIAYYLENVPFGTVLNALVPDSNPYDLDRVEVLRGPQGTLYGASAAGGVVRVLTRDANPDAFELKARTSVSSTDGGGENYRGDAAINVPIVDGKLAARAVLGYQDLSGWIDRPNLNREDANDAEIRNARLKLNAKPTDPLSIGLSAWLSRADYGAPSQSADGDQNSLLDEPMSTDFDLYGVNIRYELPWFSISSMTGYIDYANDGFLDIRPFLPESLRTQWDADTVSQEVILTSTHGGPWRWTLGGMYRDGEDGIRQSFGSAPSGSLLARTNTSKQLAVFGELTRGFFDGHLEVTGGLRYFDDEVSQFEFIGPETPPNDPLFPFAGTTFRSEASFDKVSPRAVLTWLPNKNVTAYASYSEGFRSGSDQSPAVFVTFPSIPALKPDNLKNYELGTKERVWGGRLNIDAAIYYMDWQDVQEVLLVPVAGSDFISARVNSESASGWGTDLGIMMEPADGLELGLTFSWNDLTVDKDVFTQGVVIFDRGDRLNLSPEYTAGASASYRFRFGNNWEARISASGSYTSEKSLASIFQGEQVHTVGDEMLVAQTSFSVTSPNHWTATLFVDNINNEDGIAQWNLAFTEGPFADWAQRVRPRTIGLQLEYQLD